MIRRLRDPHEDPGLISRAATPVGQVVLWILASALLSVQESTVLMPLALAAVMALPARRRLILSAAAVGAALEFLLGEYGVRALTLVLFAGVVLLPVTAVLLLDRLQRLPGPLRRHPVLAVHGGIWVALGLAAVVPALGFLAKGISPFLWRLSYLAQYMARPSGTERRLRDHLFYLVRPVWGDSNVPYGKGLGYLSKSEAHEPLAVARSQLAGLKLLWLALLWTWLAALMDAALYDAGRLGVLGLQLHGADVPHVDEILAAGRDTPRTAAWLSLYLELIRRTLGIAAAGHLIVGCLRLLGYNVFRNTYKPLLAESIVEFWNRYYYYFKELLVEFFFYPVFLGARRVPPRARLALAVFAAAGFGNMYYHVLGKPELILAGDVGVLWKVWGARLVYCLLLATGVWASMLRRQLRPPAADPSGLVRTRRIAGVWTYFGLINVFNVGTPDWGLGERFALTGYLFGL